MASNLARTLGSRTSDGEPASEWQEAALRGKAREECYSRYNCLINPMWILNFFMKSQGRMLFQ